jgi:hypothetical protein
MMTYRGRKRMAAYLIESAGYSSTWYVVIMLILVSLFVGAL